MSIFWFTLWLIAWLVWAYFAYRLVTRKGDYDMCNTVIALAFVVALNWMF
jgi:hypothetical protein